MPQAIEARGAPAYADGLALERRVVGGAVAGEAFVDALARNGASLRAAARRLARTDAEVDDLLQDAAIRAWTFWGRFEPGTNARAWMLRILTNTFLSGCRRRRRDVVTLDESVLAAAEPSEAPSSESGALSDEVAYALASLPEEFRAVVLLVDLDELSYREVAAVLGCPIGTVMSRLHRGRRVLRERLAAYAEHEGYSAAA